MIIGTAGISRLRIRAASRPFITGMERSRTMKLGWTACARSMASRPLTASPHTCHPGSDSRHFRRRLRTSGLSSTISTRGGIGPQVQDWAAQNLNGAKIWNGAGGEFGQPDHSMERTRSQSDRLSYGVSSLPEGVWGSRALKTHNTVCPLRRHGFQNANPARDQRVNSLIQFASQVFPPSAENDCSIRNAVEVMPEKTKRTKIAWP